MKGKFYDILQAKSKDNMKAMKSKSVKAGAQGRKATAESKVVEENFIEWLK